MLTVYLTQISRTTGHDFAGRATGARALSIWTHYLESFEYLPSYNTSAYHGRAAHVGVGLESWELHNHMAWLNLTILASSWDTVGGVGGWMLGGGRQAMQIYARQAEEDGLLSCRGVAQGTALRGQRTSGKDSA